MKSMKLLMSVLTTLMLSSCVIASHLPHKVIGQSKDCITHKVCCCKFKEPNVTSLMTTGSGRLQIIGTAEPSRSNSTTTITISENKKILEKTTTDRAGNFEGILYLQAGEHKIKVTASNKQNCSKSTSFSVRIIA